MDKLERLTLAASGVLMTVFFAALVYAATSRNIGVATCVTNIAPFDRGEIIPKGDNHYEVHVVARMWAFEPAVIELPPGADVDLYVSARDVTHGLYIENTNVNLMAVPGAVNGTRVHFDHEGTFHMICHEYCGVAHHMMAGKVVIRRGVTVAPPVPPAAKDLSTGAKLFEAKGCADCHSIDGSESVGPSLKGLFGRATHLEDGRTIIADQTYVEKAIQAPNDSVVKGFDPMMPEPPLTDAELQTLVDYLKSVS